jgi:acyl carrier protein
MKNQIEIIEKFILRSLVKIKKKYKNFNKKKSFFDQSMDSLDFMKLTFLIEKKYKIKFSSRDFNKIQSINNVVKFIKKKL